MRKIVDDFTQKVRFPLEEVCTRPCEITVAKLSRSHYTIFLLRQLTTFSSSLLSPLSATSKGILIACEKMSQMASARISLLSSFVPASSDFEDIILLLTDDLNEELRDFVAALKFLLCFGNRNKFLFQYLVFFVRTYLIRVTVIKIG